MTQPMAVPTSWPTNIDFAGDRERHSLLRSCIKSAAVKTIDIIIPQVAHLTMTLPLLPTSKVIIKRPIFP